MASTRNSFLRAAAPGSVRFRCDEAILPSIAKHCGEPCRHKKRGAPQSAPQNDRLLSSAYLPLGAALALCGCTASSKRVPPSRCTFFALEVSTVPSPLAFAVMRTPSSPYTPRMFDGSGPPELDRKSTRLNSSHT